MEYKNLITRIDDRLIHGQVNVGWIQPLHIKRVYVVDNESSKDDFIVNLWSMSLDEDSELRVFNEEDFIEKYNTLDFNDSMILIKSIEVIYDLVKKVPDLFREINIGGLHYMSLKLAVFPWFFISQVEIEQLKELFNKGINFYIQMVLNSQRIDVDQKFLQKIEELWQKNHA